MKVQRKQECNDWPGPTGLRLPRALRLLRRGLPRRQGQGLLRGDRQSRPGSAPARPSGPACRRYCAASSPNYPTDSRGNFAACIPRESIPSAILPSSSPTQDQPSVVHSTGTFPRSVPSCPLPDFSPFLRNPVSSTARTPWTSPRCSTT